MNISVFDLFSIGIGPSSSHTVGPMRAAKIFAEALQQTVSLDSVHAVRCDLYGSLGATGKSHGSNKAVLMGLEGERPESIDVASIDDRMQKISANKSLRLLGTHDIAFDPDTELDFKRNETLEFHPNGLTFTATDNSDTVLLSKTYFSVGGGFVVHQDNSPNNSQADSKTSALSYPFTTGAELLQHCRASGKNISDIMLANETCWRDAKDIHAGLLKISEVMSDCISRGCNSSGILPGGMKVKRRAQELHQKLSEHPESSLTDPLNVMDWINLYALAVSEENAAGGRVVTAPTNGAAGIIPAVMQYCKRFCKATDEDMVRFLLTAAAIGSLYKENASISGADVGCQGEVGVACSMAAGALAEFMGGTPEQVENAAEIGMEHNLGLTCDPVGGLVQVPCIERNAMGAVKALNAARLALRGDGEHYVTLDKVIKTMRETGRDMQSKYKETARGGLAVNVIEC
jgi:L-serine dehydratase